VIQGSYQCVVVHCFCGIFSSRGLIDDGDISLPVQHYLCPMMWTLSISLSKSIWSSIRHTHTHTHTHKSSTLLAIFVVSNHQPENGEEKFVCVCGFFVLLSIRASFYIQLHIISTQQEEVFFLNL
jgi:hypothetical protein